LTATVVAVSGTTTPTGTVTFIGNDLPLGTVGLTLSAGVPTATLTVDALLIAGGNGTLTVFYGGDNAFLGSGASATVSLKLPATGSSVVPSVTPNPVTEILSLWPYDVRLTEKAGVATKLTGFTINGVNQNLNAFGTTTIPANGSISASLAAQNIVPPLNRTFHFTGVDANGATWAQDITVPFVGPAGPPFKPTMSLTSTPAVVLQNPQADASCQWSQQLTVQEQAGFYVLLTNFLVGTSDFSSSIQQAFGTTRLAPFGTLHADICWSGTTPPTPKNFGLAGESEVGTFVSAVTSSTFGPAASNAASLSVTPPVVEMLTDSAPTGASTSVALNFAGGTPQWTASVAPLNRTSSWLTVSPLSGAGPATLNIQAAGGLSKGVYDATLVIQSANSIPQSISVRVILVVGTSSSTSISDVVNAASSTPAFAPGMSVNVLGSGLAPSSQKADGFPLPFIMDGVSATVNGVSAPLYSVSPGNINLQIPYETGSGMAILGINNNGTLASHLLPISVVAPRIFTAQNGFLDRVANGSPGQTLTAFVTGDGDLAPFLATGATPPPDTRLADLPRPLLPVSVTVGGVPGTIRFIGIPSGLVGVTQINFTIPLNAPPGVQPLVVTVGGVGSAPAYLRVSQ
jgi:uncharacterized protein (TIGR03437 family)